jgi:hypothetical protein
MSPSCLSLFTTCAILFLSTAQAQQMSSMSSCQLQLQLDQYPADTAWEIRGPFPSVDLVASRDYDYYQTPHALDQESVQLQQGGTYHLIFTDYANDGIHDGHFSLIQNGDTTPVVQQQQQKQHILTQGDGNFGAGQVYTFEVPTAASYSSSLLSALTRTLLSGGWSLQRAPSPFFY